MSAEPLIFEGEQAFELCATHGLPLAITIDRVVNEAKFAIGWVGFIEAARRGGWLELRIYLTIEHGLADADVPRDYAEAVLKRVRLYMMRAAA